MASSSGFAAINAPQQQQQHDTRTANLRCPTTTTCSDFWYITPERWNEYLAEVADPSKAKAALNNLRKFDAAGRIMETNEGVAAVEVCVWCGRDGSGVECKVFQDKAKGEACAYCKRHGKSGCSASAVKSPPTIEERVAALEAELAAAKVTMAEQARKLEAQQGWISQIAGEFKSIGDDITTVWERLWP